MRWPRFIVWLPNAGLAEPFVLRCDQERDNLNALQEGLNDASASLPH
jgi:hypothetical protein